MNKIIRISVPFMVSFLFISILISVGWGIQLGTAAPLRIKQWGDTCNNLDDELNTDGDCSARH
jgi:hypothetical protein